MEDLKQQNYKDTTKLLDIFAVVPVELHNILLELVHNYCEHHGLLLQFAKYVVALEVEKNGILVI